MPSTFKRIIFVAVLLVVLAAGAVALVLSGSNTGNSANPVDSVKNGAVNAALDASGVKQRIDTELRSRAGELASKVGISEAMVDEVMNELDIPSWQATTLPSDAQQTASFQVNAEGTAVQVTTYEDPSYLTLGAYGQELTMAVPESAQTYVNLLEYAQYLQ